MRHSRRASKPPPAPQPAPDPEPKPALGMHPDYRRERELQIQPEAASAFCRDRSERAGVAFRCGEPGKGADAPLLSPLSLVPEP